MARGHSIFNLGQYTFASYARRGVANSIAPDGATLVRARIPLNVTLNAEAITQDVELIGPADVANVTQNAIVRTAPLDRSFDFEWNMLPYVEFYDEDFLWRYTPDAPVADKLRPWLALVVVKAEEFSEIKRPNGALSAVRLQTSALPPATEWHLWAHLHTGEQARVKVAATDSQPLDHQPLSEAVLADVLKQIGENYPKDPDGFTCRLLSPRRLSPRTLYHAFLIPFFETGRLAGLGEDFSKTPARQAAWTDENRSTTLDFPVYHRWTFATSEASFEDLISKLKSASANPNVGVREMDTSQPGYVKAAGAAPVGKTVPPVMRLEGALRTPATESTDYAADGSSDEFQTDIAALLRLYDQTPASPIAEHSPAKMDGDPILTVPLYGRSYTNPNASPTPLDGQNWYSAVNFDPRNRVAAGVGTRVVQKDQEELMKSAWLQLQTLRKARNNFAAVGIIIDRMATRFRDETLMSKVDFISMSRNLLARVKALNTNPGTAPITVFKKLKVSATPDALINSATRRIMRPGGAAARRFRLTTSVTAATDSKAISNLKVLNDQLTNNNNAVLEDLRLRKINIANVASGVLTGNIFGTIGTAAQQTPFDKAYRHFIKRAAVAPTAIGGAFNFVQAAQAVFTSVASAPAQLMKARVKMPADQTAFADRPPAELLGQPFFNEPMYEPLWRLDKEWFLPNLHLIENNTVTLLETNVHFINSYMLGLNDEMGREMLWREFPADLSATFFRRFWANDDDDDSHIAPFGFDIEPIKNWLGTRAAPRQSTGQNARLVLTVRGDLLRKFPNTVIFLANLKRDAAGKLAIEPNSFRFPLFRADLPPDLQFVGFDLTVKQTLETVNGGSWYFVLMEPVGEPRFGLDAAYRPAVRDAYHRNDLAWEHIDGGGDFLTANQKPTAPKMPDAEKNLWGKNAAAMAAMLFQQPFAQFIKAADLLNGADSNE